MTQRSGPGLDHAAAGTRGLTTDVAESAFERRGTPPMADRGRLGVYAALGAYAGAVPLPWVPHALARRVRGALVHDVAARHGLSLTPEARGILVDTAGPDEARGLAGRAMRYVGWEVAARMMTRFGPLGLVWPVRHALQMYALGHLFGRYLDLSRGDDPVRIDSDEARRIRRAIDGALARAITVQTAPMVEPTVVDDQRDAATALVDGLISLTAGVPARLVRRLEAAFDALIAQAHG